MTGRSSSITTCAQNSRFTVLQSTKWYLVFNGEGSHWPTRGSIYSPTLRRTKFWRRCPRKAAKTKNPCPADRKTHLEAMTSVICESQDLAIHTLSSVMMTSSLYSWFSEILLPYDLQVVINNPCWRFHSKLVADNPQRARPFFNSYWFKNNNLI